MCGGVSLESKLALRVLLRAGQLPQYTTGGGESWTFGATNARAAEWRDGLSSELRTDRVLDGLRGRDKSAYERAAHSLGELLLDG
jgi:hypothetical protein